MASNLKSENDFKGLIDFKSLHEEAKVPQEFIWSSEDLVETSKEELNVPVIDLEAIFNGDDAALAAAAKIVRETCMEHGFFQVTNHGVDQNLIDATYQEFVSLFKLPLDRKLNAMRNPWGYSGAHAARYSASLPWKETFTFQYKHYDQSETQIVDFFTAALGDDHQHAGWVLQKYCEAMKKLTDVILELLAISLDVDRSYYKKFFEDAETMMRCNSYPPCSGIHAGALGTGPHCDPTSVTILFQDQVGGLEAFVDNKWLGIRPQPNNFVINIGDTFKALTNGVYKSCLHRVLANREKDRKTLAFFLCPKGDKIVRAPENILGRQEPTKYPDFTWKQFFEFTQRKHRADPNTLPDFVSWINSNSSF
ncbi:putative gibberellin-44 dioxygenase [Medicago truncatula]|uniref:Gibberellin 20-oxidase n=1 Tax=Medicago truncatula TaxID=3880 RepID=G7LE46_MEDTR|nr:gibberellin 20 oxidase 3 [Medicago truncatula]AET04768.1 gibberellin 20-oxidase [Medicago truncatula]RHN43131.1 putative gibberellin-44 dioxygenase [Medicago truncatula]